MKIHFADLPDKDLAELIAAAMTEWANRQAPQVVTERRAAPTVTVTINEPAQADKRFCLHIAQRLDAGDYIRAEERRRVAEIAKDYGAWVRHQGLPDTHNAGDWKRIAGMNRVGYAPER